jgi:hypothetical protein
MSGGDWKKPFYAVAKQDSDNMEGIARAVGWDWLEDEAKTNQKNPGRAIGKAAGYAVGSMLGGWLGGAGGAAGSAATEAGTAAGTTAAEVAAEQAAMQGGQVAATGAGDAGLLGMTTAQSAPGAGAYELGTVGEQATLGMDGFAKMARPPTSIPNAVTSQFQGLLGGGGGGGNADKAMKAMQVYGLLNPQQPQQGPMPVPPPQQQGSPDPLASPYQQNPYGPGGNSLGMTEEERRRRMMMMGLL